STKPAGADTAAPRWATAALVLADGAVFWGKGVGAPRHAVGEVCFNTSMTGYQEIVTDPSYAGQIITFTFPHVGNVGTNIEDIESINPAARGVVLRGDITEPANWRAAKPLDDWLKGHNLPGACGVDTREITRRVRDGGAPNGVVVHAPDGKFDIPALRKEAQEWPGLDGMDLAIEVTTKQTYSWTESTWALGKGYGKLDKPRHHVVAVDYGAKRNILRCLANQTVNDVTTGKGEITSQNHGFCVIPESLPKNVQVTHISLFDGSNEGLRCTDKPAFSVQYHPEASPGPTDSHYLFDRFVEMI